MKKEFLEKDNRGKFLLKINFNKKKSVDKNLLLLKEFIEKQQKQKNLKFINFENEEQYLNELSDFLNYFNNDIK
jgi:hypothetical protein